MGVDGSIGDGIGCAIFGLLGLAVLFYGALVAVLWVWAPFWLALTVSLLPAIPVTLLVWAWRMP